MLLQMTISERTPGDSKDCGIDPWVVIHDKCSFIDQQVIKLQETLDMIPVGELPRHMLMTADRYEGYSSCAIPPAVY